MVKSLVCWRSKSPIEVEEEDPYSVRLKEAADIARRIKSQRRGAHVSSITEEEIISRLEEDLIGMGDEPEVAHEAALAQVRTHPVVQQGENTVLHYITLTKRLPVVRAELREAESIVAEQYNPKKIVNDDCKPAVAIATTYTSGMLAILGSFIAPEAAIAGGALLPAILTTIGTRGYWVNGIRKAAARRRRSKATTKPSTELSKLEQELSMYEARSQTGM